MPEDYLNFQNRLNLCVERRGAHLEHIIQLWASFNQEQFWNFVFIYKSCDLVQSQTFIGPTCYQSVQSFTENFGVLTCFARNDALTLNLSFLLNFQCSGLKFGIHLLPYLEINFCKNKGYSLFCSNFIAKTEGPVFIESTFINKIR